MSQGSWEIYATQLANAASEQDLLKIHYGIAEAFQIQPQTKAKVVFARDTRASGSRLVSALVEALQVTETEYSDYKLLTTPQLHYITRCLNTQATPFEYGVPSEQGYYEKIAAALKTAMKGRKFNGPVTVDCANGVGGPKLRELMKYLHSPTEGGIEIKVVNDDIITPERLNHQVRTVVYPSTMVYMLKPNQLYSAELTTLKQISVHLRLYRLRL